MRAAGAGVAAAVLCMCVWVAAPAGALDIGIAPNRKPTVVNTPNVAGAWTEFHSPYYIDCNITVPADQTLAIDPGVSVIFRGPFYLNVKGRLVANGTPLRPIIFSPQDIIDGWRGIRFDNCVSANPSSLMYCDIRHSVKVAPPPGVPMIDSGGLDGGAILIDNYSGVNITSCIISNSRAPRFGGGIYVRNGSPTITGNTIIFNDARAGSGGGIYCCGSSNSMITNNIISHNLAGYGGGIMCQGAPPDFMMQPFIIGNLFEDNWAGYGAGCAFEQIPEDSAICVSGNTLQANLASESGGGFCFSTDCYMTIGDNVISENVVRGPDDGWPNGGGGVFVGNFNSISMEGNLIEGNEAVYGGGIMSDGDGSRTRSTKDIIRDNVARRDGGGVYLGEAGDIDMVLVNDLLVDNQAETNGGGVSCAANDIGLKIVNTTISGNTAQSGGGYYFAADALLLSINTILWGNLDIEENPSEVYMGLGCRLTFKYCDVRGGCGAFTGPGAAAYNADIHYTPYFNIEADPLFVEQGVHPYAQKAGVSPCINRGMNAMPAGIFLPATDLANHARILGGRVDIGAYEVPFGQNIR